MKENGVSSLRNRKQSSYSNGTHSSNGSYDEKDAYLKNFEPTCALIMKNDNPFLHTGYREECGESIWKCAGSTFTLHNDTCNIWTHLGGALWMFYLMYDITFNAPLNSGTTRISNNQHFTAPADDWWAFMIFLIFTSICLLASTSYHIWRVHRYAFLSK